MKRLILIVGIWVLHCTLVCAQRSSLAAERGAGERNAHTGFNRDALTDALTLVADIGQVSIVSSADTVCPDSLVLFSGALHTPTDTVGAVWQWDFGDGNNAEGFSTSHRFSSVGVYRVTLLVQKNGVPIANSVSVEIVVAPVVLRSSEQAIDFGRVAICTPSVDRIVKVRNIGRRLADIGRLRWASASGAFSVEARPPELTPGEEGEIRLRFRRLDVRAGVLRDTLTVEVEPCGTPLVIAVVATVEPSALEASDIDFGSFFGCEPVQVARALTVKNRSNTSVVLTGITAPNGYTVTNITNPIILLPSEEFVFSVRLYTSTVGTYNGDVLLAYKQKDCTDTLAVALRAAVLGDQIPVQAIGDVRLCAGESAALWASGGVRYRWTPADGLDDPTSATPVARPERSTVYRVEVSNEAGCTGSTVVAVTVGGVPNFVLSADTALCGGGVAYLRAEGAERYEWTPASGLDDPRSATPVAALTQTTEYQVRAWVGECSTTASVRVVVHPVPELSVQESIRICRGERVVLSAEASPGVRYRWQPEEGLDDPSSPYPVATPSQTTVYTVEVLNDEGCRQRASTTVEVVDFASVELVIPDTSHFARVLSLPVYLRGDGTPVSGVELEVSVEYPSRLFHLQSVSGAVLKSDTRLSSESRLAVLRIGPFSADVPQKELCVLHGTVLLSGQTIGSITPHIDSVLGRSCLVVEGKAGVLASEGFCLGYDLRRYHPLRIAVVSEAEVELSTSIAGTYELSIYSVYGQLVSRQEVALNGSERVRVDIGNSAAAAGLYLVRVSGMLQSAESTVVLLR